MSFSLLPLDHEDAFGPLPSLNMISNTLLLIQTIKHLPAHSLTCLDKTQQQQTPQQSLEEEDSLGVEINNMEKTTFQTPEVRKKKTGCTCKKTNCLKRYCQCFSSGQSCGPQCGCEGCYNTQEYDKLVKQTKAEIKLKSSRKVFQGCVCKKSQCQKKYCQCFNAGLACTDACKCLNCQNHSSNSHSHSHQHCGSEVKIRKQKSPQKVQVNTCQQIKSELSISPIQVLQIFD